MSLLTELIEIFITVVFKYIVPSKYSSNYVLATLIKWIKCSCYRDDFLNLFQRHAIKKTGGLILAHLGQKQPRPKRHHLLEDTDYLKPFLRQGIDALIRFIMTKEVQLAKKNIC